MIPEEISSPPDHRTLILHAGTQDAGHDVCGCEDRGIRAHLIRKIAIFRNKGHEFPARQLALAQKVDTAAKSTLAVLVSGHVHVP